MPRTRPKRSLAKREQTANAERQRTAREKKAQNTGRNANLKLNTREIEQ